jgi:CheY-like chemotaxis protein
MAPPAVLLVEDSKTQAYQIKETLEEVGLEVTIAYDGPEGIRAAVESPPDLVVLDVKLPTMDGFQVCRRLKMHPATRDVPIIMLTEKTSAEATMTGLSAGADDYIPKDIFATEHLIASLQELGVLD